MHYGTVKNPCNDISGFSYWQISDWSYEYAPSSHRYHGGFGLFTRDNIPKAAYGALQLLNMAKGKILLQNPGCFVLRSEDDDFMIYLYHYCPYDILYRYRHVRDMDFRNRYGVFETKRDINYYVMLEGLAEGVYQKKEYRIGPENGSSCDAWMRMGAPELMDGLEYNYVLAASAPECCTCMVEAEGEYVVQSLLKPHEIQLIVLHKVK